MLNDVLDPPSSPTATPGRGQAVLVSGASFAGLATAFWLNRLGYRVTVVEAAAGLRRGGTPVDIEGETIATLTRMGLIGAVRARALPRRAFAFKDADDVTLGALGAGSPADDGTVERYEIHRDDLLDILSGAVEGTAAFLFGRSIRKIVNEPNSVSVTLDDGSERTYALAFGCDGNRSNTRKLVFGDDAHHSYFMGGYFFLKVVPEIGLLPANTSEVFAVPGRMAMLNGYDDRTDIGLGFRSEGEIDYDYRDRGEQQRLVHDRCDGLGWKVPEMLQHVDAGDDFYFDRITQIRMERWSKGRVALVGDAGYCVSPLAGFGGSMAIIGAERLADALRKHPHDHAAAFSHYETGLRPFVEEVQERAVSQGLSMMCPATEEELLERDRKLAAGKIDI